MDKIPHEWLHPASFSQAAELQRQLAQKVIVKDDFPTIKRIGGVDVSCNFRDPARMIYSAAVSIDAKKLDLVDKCAIAAKQDFPYVTGFLAFREAPSIVNALRGLKQAPDLLMVDGQGICHPRGLGIASHLGVLCDLPTIGVGKTILVGEPSGTLGQKRGDRVPLIFEGRVVGVLLRTRPRVHPLIVSIGHRISLDTAVEMVLACLTRFRLPEPTRQAHLEANVLRRMY